MNLLNGNEIVIDFSHPVEFVNGLTTEININFYVQSIKKEVDDTFSIDLSSAKYISSSIDLPFQPGVLLVSLTRSVTIAKNKDGISKTGLETLDEILFKHRCVLIKRIIDDFPDLDLEVAEEVGLVRTYIFLFEYSQDVIEAMLELKNNPNIESITTDVIMEAEAQVPDDTLAIKPSASQVGQLELINAYEGWNWFKNNSREIGNEDIKIAVVDSGIDDTHEDINKNRIIQGLPFRYGESRYCEVTLPVYKASPLRFPCMDDTVTHSRPHDSNDPDVKLKHYHGTAVASIIGAETDNGKGMAGINWKSKLISINVFNADGKPSIYSIALGILEAVKKEAKVINISLGGDNGSSECGREKPQPTNAPIKPSPGCRINSYLNYGFEHKMVQYAYKKGVVMVASAGNNGKKFGKLGNGLTFGHYPSGFPEVISVSALNLVGQNKWKDSNYGEGQIDIAAPGVLIYSAARGDTYKAIREGTSMAAPMVSALASLILSVKPDMHPKLVLETMCKSATKLPNTTEDKVGCGRINIGEVFTNSATDPSQSFPEISVHPNYTSTCETNSGSPIVCYKDRHYFVFDGNGIKTYAQPLMVEGGKPPYTCSSHNLLDHRGKKSQFCKTDFFVNGLYFKPYHINSRFYFADSDKDEKIFLSHLNSLIGVNETASPQQPKSSALMLDWGLLNDCTDQMVSWTVDIKVTDDAGRSDMKQFEFFKDYSEYWQYKRELERQNLPEYLR